MSVAWDRDTSQHEAAESEESRCPGGRSEMIRTMFKLSTFVRRGQCERLMQRRSMCSMESRPTLKVHKTPQN